MSYTHLSLEDRTALMLESQKAVFHQKHLPNKSIDIILQFIGN